MSNILSYEFEELPLHIHNGIPAALINGMAEIKYNRGGHWEVDSVTVEGHQSLTPEQRAAGKKPWVYVEAPVELALIIQFRLEQEWFDKVQDAVSEQLSSDREDVADARADARRDERMGY